MSDTPQSMGQALLALRDARAAIDAIEDSVFQQRLAELRAWQSAKVATFHTQRAAAYNGDDLLDFLTRRFYLEGDWSELIGQPTRVAGTVARLVKNDRPLVIAIQLQAVADRLDMEMANALLADPQLAPSQPISARSYLRALRQVGRQDARQRQIDWLNALIGEVTVYAHSKAAWWGFKMANKPAHAMRMGRTYDLLADGFRAMRACEDLEVATRDVVDAQQARLKRLFGVSNQ